MAMREGWRHPLKRLVTGQVVQEQDGMDQLQLVLTINMERVVTAKAAVGAVDEVVVLKRVAGTEVVAEVV